MNWFQLRGKYPRCWPFFTFHAPLYLVVSSGFGNGNISNFTEIRYWKFHGGNLSLMRFSDQSSADNQNLWFLSKPNLPNSCSPPVTHLISLKVTKYDNVTSRLYWYNMVSWTEFVLVLINFPFHLSIGDSGPNRSMSFHMFSLKFEIWKPIWVSSYAANKNKKGQ